MTVVLVIILVIIAPVIIIYYIIHITILPKAHRSMGSAT